jgi:hypothetical protein
MVASVAGVQISIRVPSDALKRADSLRSKVGKDKNVAALGKVTRSTVLKLAMIRGLEQLEREYK